MNKPLDIEQLKAELPEQMQRVMASRKAVSLQELFPKSDAATIQAARESGVLTDNGHRYGLFLDSDGFVTGLAAVTRTTTRSYEYVRNVADFKLQSGTKRADNLDLYYRIYRNEGIINNAVNKGASLVSTDGTFHVRRAKKGKRPRGKVRDELAEILNWWAVRVNSRPISGPITGARGLTQIMEQGTRQALIEGSYVAVWHPQKVAIESLGAKYTLPMFIQTLSTRYIEVPTELVGTGFEVFYWVPPTKDINNIIKPKDPAAAEIIKKAMPKDFLAQLTKDKKVLLPGERVIHIKHRGVEFEPFGESVIESVIPDIKYKRALQDLEFVTIDSLINRLVIVKVGSDKPDSHYHNIETAQERLKLLAGLYNEADGPNMHLLWAGPDIDVLEVGAHSSLLDVTSRFEMAHERIRLGLGVPKTLLDGSDASGQIWAGYEGYRETLRGIQNAWTQAMTSLGERVAELNNFEDVDIVYMPNSSLLADQQAGADLMLRAYKSGLTSLHRLIPAIGGDYEAERRNRVAEMGLDPDGPDEQLPPDAQIFSPPLGLPGDTRTNPDGKVVDPGGEPGRRPDSQREDLAPERQQENRNNRDAQQ